MNFIQQKANYSKSYPDQERRTTLTWNQIANNSTVLTILMIFRQNSGFKQDHIAKEYTTYN